MTGPALIHPARRASHDSSIAGFWLLMALLLTISVHVALLNRPFLYAHGWVSAHLSTTARSFADLGIWNLGLAPLQNNPPLTETPDFYLHWPPAFQILLGLAFRAFGSSETTAHAVMLVILLANTAALYALVKLCFGRTAARFAAFSFLLMPVTIHYGHLVTHLHLCIFFMLLSLLAFLKATDADRVSWPWGLFGAVAIAAAVWTSWESALLYPALFAVAAWQRKRPALVLAACYSILAAASAVGVLWIYARACPGEMKDLFQTVRYRIGLSDYPAHADDVHLLINAQSYKIGRLSPWVHLVMFFERWRAVGPLGVAAIAWAVITGWKRRRSNGGRAAILMTGLAAPWLLWTMLMPVFALFHDYAMMLIVPLASAAMGWVAVRLCHSFDEIGSPDVRDAGRIGVLGIAPLILLLSAGWALSDRLSILRPPSSGWVLNERMMKLAQDVRKETEPNSIVLMPFESMIPVYYSHRHVIRTVNTDDLVDQVIRALPKIVHGSSFYLALDPRETKEFPKALQRYKRVFQSDHLLLLRISESPTTAKSEAAAP